MPFLEVTLHSHLGAMSRSALLTPGQRALAPRLPNVTLQENFKMCHLCARKEREITDISIDLQIYIYIHILYTYIMMILQTLKCTLFLS